MVSTQRHLKMTLIRKEIDALLSSPSTEDEWDDLVEDQYIEELLQKERSIKSVADKLRHRRRVYGKREKLQSNEPDMLSKEEAKSTHIDW